MSLERIVRGTTVPRAYNLGVPLGVPGVGTQAQVYADMTFQVDGSARTKMMAVLEALNSAGHVINKGMVSGTLADDPTMTAGLYRVRFRAAYPDGSIEYFPSEEPLSLQVLPEPVVLVTFPHALGKSLALPSVVRKAVGTSRFVPYAVAGGGTVVVATLDFGGGNGMIVTADVSWFGWDVFVSSGSGPSQPYLAELDTPGMIAYSHSAQNAANQMVSTVAQHAAGLRALVPGWTVQVVGDPNFVPGETVVGFVYGSTLDGGLPSGGQTNTQDGGLYSGGQSATIDGGTP